MPGGSDGQLLTMTTMRARSRRADLLLCTFPQLRLEFLPVEEQDFPSVRFQHHLEKSQHCPVPAVTYRVRYNPSPRYSLWSTVPTASSEKRGAGGRQDARLAAAPQPLARGGKLSAGAARWRARGRSGATRRAVAPPWQRGVGLLSAAPVGTVAAGSSCGVCLRRQRGRSAAPQRPLVPSHTVVMEEPRWRRWPTPGASGRSTTTSA